MEQLLLHLFGDFIVQNDWMALNKKNSGNKGALACMIHCFTYAVPFYFIASPSAVFVIYLSHYILDRTHIVERFLAFRNGVDNIKNFGFGAERPFAITVWLMIITDNIIHLIINYFAIKYL